MTGSKIAYCTIASANYLPRVRVLEESLLAHNPDASLHILLCERPEICRTLSKSLGRPLISPDEVCADWLDMAFYYDLLEYNTALKPFLLEHLLNSGYDAVFYFDPDIEIFGSLKPLEALASTYRLILTPHICEPIPMDGLLVGIDSVVRAGQFNLGFIGLAANEESRKALKWWADVCREYCLFDTQHRFFVDQFWADILPSFIQDFYCLRDPAYNMAYWNVFQRKLEQENGRWVTNSGELKFFHFSGLPEDLTQVSRYQNRITTPQGSPLYQLLASYRDKIERNPWAAHRQHPYSFATYANGKAILPAERRKFLSLAEDERHIIGNPFQNPEALRRYQPRRQPSGKTLFQKYVSAIRQRGVIAAHWAVIGFLLQQLAHRLHFSRRNQP